MALDADALADRRRMRRRLSLWRAAAVIAVAALFVALAMGDRIEGGGPAVARISVDGVIGVDDRGLLNALEDVAEDDRYQALIVRINSPGGTTAGSEALYEAIRRVGEDRPVVAVMGGVAASGGYIAALGADYIVARGNTLTGSIGVIFEAVEISEMLDSLGVAVSEVKSAPLKAEPSISKPMSAEVRAALQALIDDGFDWFVDLVAERRDLSSALARERADGRVFSGRQAKDLGLIDALGGEQAARDWLKETHDVSADLPVVDVDAEDGLQQLSRLAGSVASALGAGAERARLSADGGLMAIWRP